MNMPKRTCRYAQGLVATATVRLESDAFERRRIVSTSFPGLGRAVRLRRMEGGK